MQFLLLALVPLGLVKIWRSYKELRVLGLSMGRAWRAAFDPQISTRLHRSRLNLLPTGSLTDGCVAVDVGANSGNWSEDLLRLVSPGQLLIIEPDPRLRGGLEAKFRGRGGVELCPVAVGGREGMLPFRQMENPAMNSFLPPTPETLSAYGSMVSEQNVVNVPVRTLDELTSSLPKIDLLKIDVQGYEEEVLRGAAHTLQRTAYILLEVNFVSHYQGELDFAELDGIMRRHGFALCNLSPPCRGNDGRVLWTDALYGNQANKPAVA